jgi:hypothetical protein
MGLIDWVGMIFTFSSSFLLSNKKRAGWIFYILSSVVWGIYGALVAHSLPIVLMNVVLLPNGVIGFLKWGKGPTRTNPKGS